MVRECIEYKIKIIVGKGQILLKGTQVNRDDSVWRTHTFQQVFCSKRNATKAPKFPSDHSSNLIFWLTKVISTHPSCDALLALFLLCTFMFFDCSLLLSNISLSCYLSFSGGGGGAFSSVPSLSFYIFAFFFIDSDNSCARNMTKGAGEAVMSIHQCHCTAHLQAFSYLRSRF